MCLCERIKQKYPEAEVVDGDRGVVVVGWLEDCIEHISLFLSLLLFLLSLVSSPSLPLPLLWIYFLVEGDQYKCF